MVGETRSGGGLHGGASSPRPSRIRWVRSAGVHRSARAKASNTSSDARTSRPCSSHVYQVVPTPASCATSSRRRPGVRRRPLPRSPTSSGLMLARLVRRKSASSARRRSPLPTWGRFDLTDGPASPLNVLGGMSTTRITTSLVPGLELSHSVPVNAISSLKTRRPSSPTALLFVVCLAQFMVILDVAVVNIALPSMRSGLHFSTTGLQWVVNAYTLTFAGFMMLGGRCADLLGRRRVFLFGVALFALSSLACAVANSRGLLIGARALQGFGGAIVSPATLSIITSSLPEGRERNRGLAAWGAVGGLGASTGALLGGALTQTLGWPAIFAINVPLGVLVVVLATTVIPRDVPREGPRHFDFTGALLVTAGLVALTYGIVRTSARGWGATGVLVPLAASVVLLGAFLYIEGRVAHWPLVPLSIFRLPQLRAANLIVVLMYFSMFSSFFFITLYLQQVLGDDALQAGISFLPMTLSVFTGSTLAARMVGRFGLRPTVATGLTLSTAGMLWFTGAHPR